MPTKRPQPKPADADALQFVLGGEVRAVLDVDPNMTVLDYLRTVEGRKGTKEGCAEGDCGACTVVLGELVGRDLRYRAVNACILFVPVLDGKELITVDDLRDPDGALHPVQQALVDWHGSQCGFCTPGFVMSLFALYMSGETPTRALVNDVLAGNLCRCTGYRPIVDAALHVRPAELSADRFARARSVRLRQLRAIRRHDTLTLTHGRRRYVAPVDVASLAGVLRRYPDARILAGGTDVGLWVTKEHRDLDTLVYTGSVNELQRIKVTRQAIEIGAAVSYTDALPVLAEDYPDIGEVFRRLGSVQIRNAGTVGGNIANASPIGDSMPALIALESRLVLRRGAARRELPLDAFFLGYRETALRPGEFIESLRVPRPAADRHFATYKISKRFDQDIAAVCGGFMVRLDGGRVRDARIAFGGMAATPKRAAHAERALVGNVWTQGAIDGAARALSRDFQPITDMRAGGAYRMTVARNLLYKFFLETAGGAEDTRVLAFGA